MANKISTLFTFKSQGLSKVKQDMAGVDGAFNKAKTGIKGLTAEFKQNRTAQLATVGALGAAAAASISAASDLEESINAVTVSYGENAEAVLAIGENAAQSFGMSKSEFNGFAVQFASFAKTIADKEGRNVADVLEEITTRVADVASVMNLDLATAAQLFQSTMAGSSEVARNYGYDVSAAAVETHLLTNNLVESKSAITEADKQLGRYQVLMGETALASGDFANTSDSLANSQRTLQAQVTDLSAELGEVLVPAAAAAAEKLSGLVEVAADASEIGKDAFDWMPDWLKEIASYNIGDAWGDVKERWALTWEDAAKDSSKWAELVAREVVLAADSSGESITRWTETLGELNEEHRRLIPSVGASNEAQRRAEQQEARTRREREEHTRKIDEERRALEELHGEISNNISTMFDYESGQLAITEAYERATKAAEDNETTLAENRAEVIRLGEEALALSETFALSQGAQEGSTEAFNLQREELLRLAAQFPELISVIREYIGELDRIPRSIGTVVSVNTTGGNIGGKQIVLPDGSIGFQSADGTYVLGAQGGVVTRPTEALIGEAGPEAVIPLSKTPGSSPLPNDIFGGGNTYNLTINAGIGTDGRQVGRDIVEAIKRYERANGAGWRS